jgi:hypothetical protein
MHRLLILITLPLLLLACAPEEPGAATVPKPFFDLQEYILSETDRLAAANTKVEKTISLNGSTETKKIEDLNFANDLRLFREADINKPSWFDKYETKEETLSVGHTLTSYLAQDSNLIVRRLTVERDQGATTKIEIERHTGTVLSDGRHLLTYEPAIGYDVVTSQENQFGEDLEAEISVRW